MCLTTCFSQLQRNGSLPNSMQQIWCMLRIMYMALSGVFGHLSSDFVAFWASMSDRGAPNRCFKFVARVFLLLISSRLLLDILAMRRPVKLDGLSRWSQVRQAVYKDAESIPERSALTPYWSWSWLMRWSEALALFLCWRSSWKSGDGCNAGLFSSLELR